MPFFADLDFFRSSVERDGSENVLLVYSAKGEILKTALERIPLRRMESWQPGTDSGSIRGLAFLAERLRMPSLLEPHAGSQSLLYCHTPFEAPGAKWHWSFAIADTSAGRIWIGRSWMVAEARSLSQEAFYQAANSQYKYADLKEVLRKQRYLESRAPDEPGLAVLIGLRLVQDGYRSGSPFSASSYADGALLEAIRIQAAALRDHPDFCMGHARQARYQAILGNFPAARSDLDKAAACGETFHYLSAKALLQLLAGENDSCRATVTRLENGSFPEKSYLAFEEIPMKLAEREGDLPEVERNYNRLILRDPNAPQPYGNYAAYLVKEFRFDEAVVLCDRLAAAGSYPLGASTCEEAQRKQSRYGEKHGLLEQTRNWKARLDASGNTLSIRSQRAKVFGAMALSSLALEDLDYLLARAPDTTLAREKIRILDRLGEGGETRIACRDFSSRRLESAGLDEACGVAEFHAGRIEDARGYLARVAMDKGRALAALYQGYLRGDSAAGAVEALSRDSTAAEAWAVLGNQAMAQGRFAEAETDFAKASAQVEDNPDWLAGRGEALFRQGRIEAALPYLNQALRRNRTHLPGLRARIGLFRALSAQGLAWEDFTTLARSGKATRKDSLDMREWMIAANADTLRFSREPLFSMRSGFTRNILEGKAIDRPERLSLKAMRKRRIYLRMQVSNAQGRDYAYTYRIMDGLGAVRETGDLRVSIHGEHYTQWFSYRFGQAGEAPGDWRFDLNWKDQLVAAQTIRVDP
jgi:tetratricopeptide (TPR) repeat protein